MVEGRGPGSAGGMGSPGGLTEAKGDLDGCLVVLQELMGVHEVERIGRILGRRL